MKLRSSALTTQRSAKAICFSSMALVLLCLISTVHAQDAVLRPTVSLSLIVTDKNKTSISSISKSDVRVFENKAEQVVQSIDADSSPIDYGLLIDSSGSMRDRMRSVLEAARTIVINRRPEDQIFVVRFITSEQIETVEDFTTDNEKLLAGINGIMLEGGQSAVVDAIHVGAQHLAKHKTNPKRRKALVIITDGEDRNSFYKLDHVIKLLHEHGVQVFALGLFSDAEPDASLRRRRRDKAEDFLKKVTAESGGRVFFPESTPEIIESVRQIIVDLRAQFRITYESSQDRTKKGLRKVEVKLVSPTDEKHTAIAPRGYYVH